MSRVSSVLSIDAGHGVFRTHTAQFVLRSLLFPWFDAQRRRSSRSSVAWPLGCLVTTNGRGWPYVLVRDGWYAIDDAWRLFIEWVAKRRHIDETFSILKGCNGRGDIEYTDASDQSINVVALLLVMGPRT